MAASVSSTMLFDDDDEFFFDDGWHTRGRVTDEQRQLCDQFTKAATAGDVDGVKRLLDREVPVNSGYSGCCGYYPVIIEVCKKGLVEVAEALFARGAVPLHHDCDGQDANPIFVCALQKRFPDTADGKRSKEVNDAILRLLVKYHYGKEFRQWRNDVGEGYMDHVRALADRPWWEKTGRCSFEKDDLMAMLLDVGADTFIAPGDLHVAVEDGDVDLTHALLEHGADVNEEHNGASALELIVQRWSPQTSKQILECMQLLFKFGAMLTAAESTKLLEECRFNPHIEAEWCELEDDMTNVPIAMFIRRVTKCHPYRIKQAVSHLKKVAPRVGWWRKALLSWYGHIHNGNLPRL